MIQVSEFVRERNILTALHAARRMDKRNTEYGADEAQQLAFLRQMMDTIIASASGAIAACDAIGGDRADAVKAAILNETNPQETNP